MPSVPYYHDAGCSYSNSHPTPSSSCMYATIHIYTVNVIQCMKRANTHHLKVNALQYRHAYLQTEKRN